MSSFLPFIVAVLAFCFLGSPSVHAQQRRVAPHIGYIYPAGAQAGTSCEITIGGEVLDGVKEVLLSGSGIRTTVVKFNRPLPMKRLNELRQYLEEARKRYAQTKGSLLGRFRNPDNVARILTEAGATEEEIKQFFKMREQKNDPKRQVNPQLAEQVTVKLDVAKDALPGPRDLRLLIPAGATNPLPFCVGRLAESVKGDEVLGKTIETAKKVTQPVVLNGQLLPGQVDHYAFEAKKDSHLVIAVQGRDLIPYLADAVPGWFQPVVSLYDSKGREVAYAYDFRYSPDPILCFKPPKDDTYLLEIKDALYRGREDFVYRVTIGEIPFVTGIYPMGCRTGSSATAAITGWNLKRSQVILDPGQTEGIHPLPELSNGLVVGDVPFASDAISETDEREPNNDPQHARPMGLPVIVNGRIDPPGDVDVFAVPCGAGAKLVAEINARRLGSPLDSYLKITDGAGRQVAFNDDWEDKAAGLLTHKADSYILFTATTAGMYYVHVGDSQHKGGPDYTYRLRLSAPRPDFALRVTPSAVSAPPGGAAPVTFYALRKDGYQGEVAIKLNMPVQAGFILNGGLIPAGQDKVRATLTFPPDYVDKPINLSMTGHGTVDGGRLIVHPVVPADDLIQAFVYHHLVPAKQGLAVISGSWRGGRAVMDVLSHEPITLPSGGTGRLVLSTPAYRGGGMQRDVQFELNEPPEGIVIDKTTYAPEGMVVAIRTDAAIKPGFKGNLIVEVFHETTGKEKDGKPGQKRRWSSGFLPAIPFKVVGK